MLIVNTSLWGKDGEKKDVFFFFNPMFTSVKSDGWGDNIRWITIDLYIYLLSA